MRAAVYRWRHLVKATKVNAGLAESNGRLLLGIWRDTLHVTCGLTACTPGSAPGPTLGNEYGKTLPFYLLRVVGVTAGPATVMAAYFRVYDSRHLQADCQEPASAPEPYGRQSSMGYLFTITCGRPRGQMSAAGRG